MCVQPAAVIQKLRASTQDMFLKGTSVDSIDFPTAGADRYTGYGFIDAAKALVSAPKRVLVVHSVAADQQLAMQFLQPTSLRWLKLADSIN